MTVTGIPFDCSVSLTKLKQRLSDLKGTSIDICLAHSEIKRRIRLFETNASVIVTGHYDRKIMPFQNSVFLSLDNDWEEVSYATVYFNNEKLISTALHIRQDHNTTLTLMQKSNADSLASVMTVKGHPAIDLSKVETYPDYVLKDDSGENWVYLKHIRGINLRRAFDTLWKTKHNIELTENDLAFSQVHKLQVTANYKISKSLINDYVKS